MQIYNENAYPWNRSVGPYGNMGNISPMIVADLCDEYDIPWYTTGWPYASGLRAYCESDETWKKIIELSKEYRRS